MGGMTTGPLGLGGEGGVELEPGWTVTGEGPLALSRTWSFMAWTSSEPPSGRVILKAGMTKSPGRLGWSWKVFVRALETAPFSIWI